jgi:hypothetical protein
MSQTRIIIRPLRLSDTDDMYEIMHMPNVLMGTPLLPSTTIDSWRKTIENWVTDEHIHPQNSQASAVMLTQTPVAVGQPPQNVQSTQPDSQQPAQ